MSARKVSSTSSIRSNAAIPAREAQLTLTEDNVVICRGGIEFRSPNSFAPWTEMTIAIRAFDNQVVNCSGVVIGCTGSKHQGYHVSMVFTGITEKAQEQLAAIAQSQA